MCVRVCTCVSVYVCERERASACALVCLQKGHSLDEGKYKAPLESLVSGQVSQEPQLCDLVLCRNGCIFYIPSSSLLINYDRPYPLLIFLSFVFLPLCCLIVHASGLRKIGKGGSLPQLLCLPLLLPRFQSPPGVFSLLLPPLPCCRPVPIAVTNANPSYTISTMGIGVRFPGFQLLSCSSRECLS